MMIKNKIILISINCCLLFGHLSDLGAQSFLIPKIGVSIPTTDPIVSAIEINSENGFTIGLEYQLNSGKVNFNPGIYLVRNNADLFSIDTIQGEVQKKFITKTNHKMIKISIGAEAFLANIGSNAQLNLRGAFVPTFKVGTPDYGGSDLDKDVQRGANLEFLLGIGIDISRMVLDFDYNLSLIKGFRDADIVQNGFTLSVGYKL